MPPPAVGESVVPVVVGLRVAMEKVVLRGMLMMLPVPDGTMVVVRGAMGVGVVIMAELVRDAIEDDGEAEEDMEEELIAASPTTAKSPLQL